MQSSSVNRLQKILFCLMFMFVCGSVAQAGTLDKTCYKGLESYVNGDFINARKLFEKVASKNEACSQFQLGMMYYYGHGMKKNVKQAKFWLNKASKNGFTKAAEQLKNI